MPERNRKLWKALLPLGLLTVAFAMLRRRGDEWEYGHDTSTRDAPAAPHTPRDLGPQRPRPAKRIALAAGFTTLFFAGASFTAGAGDLAVRLVDDDAAALAEQQAAGAGALGATLAEAAESPAEAAEPPAEAVEPAPAAEPSPVESAPSVAEPEGASPQPAPSSAAATAAEPAPETASETPKSVVAAAPVDARPVAPAAAPPVAAPAKTRVPATKKWVVKRAAAKPARAPEIEAGHEQGYGEPTIWLNRALPDPTPASARLSRPFAHDLAAISKRAGADWATVLAVLRAQGERSSSPATPQELRTLAGRLADRDAWKGALAVSGRTAFADRTEALADLYRFVGLESLVTGFAASKDRLVQRLLQTEGVLLYDAGRADIDAGRIDVRIVVLLGYLAERHGSVTVSSLFSGHRTYARPGVVSAHVFGHAVDVVAVGGTPIAGHQQPGGTTETAVRSVLLLPAELQPQQVISLLGLGGPSFPLRDHGDHIHVGY